MKTDEEIQAAALQHVKSIAKEFAKEQVEPFPTEEWPISIFMSGSPGAGKTEFSKSYMSELFSEPLLSLQKKDVPQPLKAAFLRIDADEYRSLFPDYNGSNSHLFQKAATRIVSAVHERALKKKISFLLDSTFSSVETAARNIRSSLKKGRDVQVIYVYQEPATAWRFVQKREKVEGRRIRREDFARIFCDARAVADEMKKRFGKEITLSLVIKDIDDPTKFKLELSIERIGDHLPRKYTSDEILEIIKSLPD